VLKGQGYCITARCWATERVNCTILHRKHDSFFSHSPI